MYITARPISMGVICKEKVGGGGGETGNWDIKIFNVINCERRRLEATLGGGRRLIYFFNKGHCGSDLFPLILCILQPICSEYRQRVRTCGPDKY